MEILLNTLKYNKVNYKPNKAFKFVLRTGLGKKRRAP